MTNIPSHLVTTHLTNPVYPVNKSTGFPILRSRTKVPLLKYSLALLHVLICFTTGHIVPGLQSFPITIPSGAAPHTPNFAAWQGIVHNSYVHFKIAMGLDPPHSQLFSAQSKEKPLQLYVSTIKRWENVIFMTTKLETREFSYSKGHEEPSESCQCTEAAPCSGSLLLAISLSWQHPGANMRLHQALVQPASSSHTNLGILHGFGTKQHY